MLRSLIAIFSFLCILSAPVFGRSGTSAADMIEAMDQLTNKIYTSAHNLNEMTLGSGLSDAEVRAIDPIINAQMNLENNVTYLMTVTSLSIQMVNESDRQTTLKALRRALTLTTKTTERSIATINRVLPTLKSPAAISEAQRVRDTIQELYEKLSAWKP